MSWPFGEGECPQCRFFEALDPPALDDVGYEIVGTCQHPRIAVDLFRMQRRRISGGCPCFTPMRTSSTEQQRRSDQAR